MEQLPPQDPQPSTSQSNGLEIEIVGGEEVFEDMEGEEIIEGGIENEFDCSITNHYESSILYELYQPIEYEHGLICRICHHLGKQVIFVDRSAYNTHRYKVHGSFNNSINCPLPTCKDAFASTIHLRRHLMINHELPLEMHHQIFKSMCDFERWRNIVESATHSQFVMHTKQPNSKRQILHCSKSEHKQVLQSRTRKLPKRRMQKEGSCCPAVISYRVEERSGAVHCFYQLYHVGHAMEDEEDLQSDQRPMALHFPDSPTFIGDRPMQYLQIDIFEMDSCVNQGLIYSYVLIITDLFTGFTWAKPMIEPLTKIPIIRIINDIFCTFGVPEGCSFSSSSWQRLLKDTILPLEDVYLVNIREILNEPPDYDRLRAIIVDKSIEEFKMAARWAEVLPWVIMEHNQSGRNSPFEKFFKRRPCSVYPLPYIPPDRDDEEIEDYCPPPPSTVFDLNKKVYMRNMDPRRGGYNFYLFGWIGEKDFVNSPHFPYKVHYSRNENPGPNEHSPFIWVSPYDLLSMEQRMSNNVSHLVIPELLCSCKVGTAEEPCNLFKNPVCTNDMSKICCEKSKLRCGYHENSSGDDSYIKMEKLTRYFAEGCTPQEKRQLRNALRLTKDKLCPQENGKVKEYPEEVAGEEVIGENGGYYERAESPDDPPPVKKKRMPVRSGAGSIIVRSAEDPTQLIAYGGSTITQQVKEITEPSGREIYTEVMVEQPPEQTPGPSTSQTTPTSYETQSKEEKFEEYIPPRREENSKRPSQEPIRRSGRPARAKVFKDFITE